MITKLVDSDTVISIKELYKTYKVWYRRERVAALSGIDLTVKKGEIFGFLGPNGAGKTTTVKLLLGLLHIDQGAISIFGRPPGDSEAKRHIGYMPERSTLPSYLRLREMLKLFGSLSGLHGQKLNRAADQAMATFGLSEVANRTLDTFSKGMMQRATLAQTIIADPDLLLLDEPAIGLDPVARKELREFFQRLRDQGKTIFLNSHELEVVQLVCDRFAILDKGKILAVEPIHSLYDLTTYVIKLGETPIAPEQLPLQLTVPASWDSAKAVLIVECGTTATLNRTIDELRGRSIQILSLNPYTVSLEELFMRYLGRS